MTAKVRASPDSGKYQQGLILHQTVHRFKKSILTKGKLKSSQTYQLHKTKELRRFVGMVTFLSNHVPSFSNEASLLRDLLKVDIQFEWGEDHQHIFEQIKQLIVSNVDLRYYDLVH